MMNYLTDEDDDERTIAEALRALNDREHLASDDPARRSTPTGAPRGSSTSTETAEEMSAEDRDYLDWQEDTDPLGPGASAPDAATVYAREAEMAERDGDAEGAAMMRSRSGSKGGSEKGGSEEAAAFLGDYDMSALDDDPFAGSMDALDDPAAARNAERGREARDELESYEDPDARRELFETTPTGPGAIHRADGTVERTAGHPSVREREAAGEPRFVPLTDEATALMEEPINEIDMSAMEPFTVEAGADYGPGSEPDINDESGYWGTATDADPTLPGHERTESPAYEASESPAEEMAEGETDGVAAALDAMEAGGMAAPADPGANALAGGAFRRPEPEAKVPTAPGSDPLALDAGLPTEGAINEARGWDVPRRILHALGAGLLGATGRSAPAFRSNADPMEETRREGIAERVSAKGANELADRRSSRDAAAAERLAEVRNTPSQLELDREARLAASDERSAGMASRRLDLTERELAAEEAGSEAERAAAERRGNPASEESARARALLQAEIDTLSPGIRAAMSAIDLSGMNADQADAYRDDLPALLRDRMGRRGGSGAGGGGAARSANMAEQWVAAGLAPDVETATAEMGAMGRTNAERALARALTGSGAGDEGTEILSGVASPILERGEARALRAQLAPLMTGYTALGDVERILREAGGVRALSDPRVMREVEPYIMALRGMVTIIQHTGTINEGERPAIDASLPSATFVNELLGGGDAATRGWRSLIERSLEGTLTTAGVPPEGLERARAILRSGRNPSRGGGAAAPAAGGTVLMERPDGRRYAIPADRVEAARASGMEPVE
jgi:hypothetical protein